MQADRTGGGAGRRVGVVPDLTRAADAGQPAWRVQNHSSSQSSLYQRKWLDALVSGVVVGRGPGNTSVRATGFLLVICPWSGSVLCKRG
jgi:hypothetical protein